MEGRPGTSGGLDHQDVGPPSDVPSAALPDRAEDYDHRMYDLARVYLTGTTQPNAVTAAEMVRALSEQDPDLLLGWLQARSTAVLASYLNALDRGDRARARRGEAARTFAAAAVRFEAGDLDAMNPFDATHMIRGQRKRLGEMTGRDHLFVAEGYRRRAATQTFLQVVHRAVAVRVGNRTTEEVFTPEQYQAMFDGNS